MTAGHRPMRDTHTGKRVCGATKAEKHTLTCTPNADGLTHSGKCSVCGYAAAAESHSFDQSSMNTAKSAECGAYLVGGVQRPAVRYADQRHRSGQATAAR